TYLTPFLRKGKKKAFTKKFTNYFKDNEKRMQYKSEQAANRPVGSGHVESAIRRIVNMRIKAPGSFWEPARAEAILFLRSKLLYGQWQNLMHYHFAAKNTETPALNHA